jgi:hypothetical protein
VEVNDPQQQAVYDSERFICGETDGETLSFEAAKAAAQALWEAHVDLPVGLPDFDFDAEEHVYDPWRHRIKLAGRKAPTTKLIHELAHAKIAALGIGPLVESHGPIFCRVFGKMWSDYSKVSFNTFRERAEPQGISVADRMPDVSGSPWAVIEEPVGLYALRPAQRAVEMGLNVKKTFTLHVRDHHPMA